RGDRARRPCRILRAGVRQDLPTSAVLQGAARHSRSVMADDERTKDLVELYLRLGDDRLVLGRRLSEGCGHAPVLEEELALGNLALDLLDQAAVLLERAGNLEGRGRSADDLSFFRDASAYRNALLVEQPNRDFAATIVRQYLFDVFDLHLATS